MVIVLSYGKLVKFERLINAYRELYEGEVFDYSKGVEVTGEVVSLSKELEEHYRTKMGSVSDYYSPLMKAIWIFFKSQRRVMEVSNRLFKLEINDSLFSFVNESSLSEIRFGNRVLDIASEDEILEIKNIFQDARGYVAPCLRELEDARKMVSEAGDKDLLSVVGGGESLLRAKICFFESVIALLEKNFQRSVQSLEEAVRFMEEAIVFINMNLDTPGEVENAKKTESHLKLLISSYKTAIKIIRGNIT